MQVNGINSFSNAQAFRGAEEGEGKKINKGAIAAGVIGAAAIAGTVAAGLHGKKVFVGPPEAEANKFKDVVKYVKAGYSDAWAKVRENGHEILESIQKRFKGKGSEGAEQAAGEGAEVAQQAAEKAAEKLAQ
ncbi:TPA: hypothetical protein IAA68_04475 [Candidatus Galligastranaerophilus faecipullorum]|nr:hypothetical protein [Candidatus Galligastranaerophilus faecipullorum]